jgi:hypothetical protein
MRRGGGMISQPVGKITIWPASCAIWKNGEFYSVTFAKSYKDGEEYKNSSSFDRDNLLALAKLADQAHSWILRQEQKDREAEKS